MLSIKEIEKFIEANSLDKSNYTANYYAFIQPGQDGSLIVTFTKGEPLTLWEFIYSKYFGGASKYGIVAILTDFGRNQIIEHFADKYLKIDDEYTHHNLAHLHLIRLANKIPDTLYFYFRKPQKEEIEDVLSALLKGVPKDVVEEMVNYMVANGSKGKVNEFIFTPKTRKIKPRSLKGGNNGS